MFVETKKRSALISFPCFQFPLNSLHFVERTIEFCMLAPEQRFVLIEGDGGEALYELSTVMSRRLVCFMAGKVVSMRRAICSLYYSIGNEAPIVESAYHPASVGCLRILLAVTDILKRPSRSLRS
jgi:hypothetical protein